MIFVWILVAGFLFETVDTLSQVFLRYFKRYYEKVFEDDYFLALYERLKYFELGIYANKKNQDIFSKILGESRIVDDIMGQVGDMLSLLIFLVGGYSLLSQVDWKIGVALLIGGCGYYAFNLRERKLDVWRRFDTREIDRSLRNIKWIVESEYHKLVYVGGSKLVLDTMQEYNSKNRTITLGYEKKKQGMEIASITLRRLIEYSIKLIVGFAVFQATASVGTMAMTIGLFHKLSGFVSKLINSKEAYEDSKEKLASLELYLTATHQTNTDIVSTVSYDRIDIQHLTFRYPSFSEFELAFFDILLRKISKSVHQTDYELNQLHSIQEAKKNAMTINPLILKDVSLHFQQGKVYGIV